MAQRKRLGAMESLQRLIGCVLLSGAMLFVARADAADEWTTANKIRYLQVNSGTPGHGYYLYNDAGWGAPSCPSATYVSLPPTVPGARELLALAMLARTLGASIRVAGECQDQEVFVGKVILVLDN